MVNHRLRSQVNPIRATRGQHCVLQTPTACVLRVLHAVSRTKIRLLLCIAKTFPYFGKQMQYVNVFTYITVSNSCIGVPAF